LEGYEVVTVADGVELLSAANVGEFDVVITDLVMPDLNGASASDIIKLYGDTTSVIAVTGISVHDIRHIKDKFIRVYHKPINASELFGYIKTLL
jgi:DNA-binding response OmpR family regulator